MTMACVALAFWVGSPWDDDWSIILTAFFVAFIAGLLTSREALYGILLVAGCIGVGLLFFAEQDQIVLVAILAFPLATSIWFGQVVRARLSRRE